MRNTELYKYLLGLEIPWTVGRVELSVKEQQVDVWADHPDGLKWPCPECGKECSLYDHAETLQVPRLGQGKAAHDMPASDCRSSIGADKQHTRLCHTIPRWSPNPA